MVIIIKAEIWKRNFRGRDVYELPLLLAKHSRLAEDTWKVNSCWFCKYLFLCFICIRRYFIRDKWIWYISLSICKGHGKNRFFYIIMILIIMIIYVLYIHVYNYSISSPSYHRHYYHNSINYHLLLLLVVAVVVVALSQKNKWKISKLRILQELSSNGHSFTIANESIVQFNSF